MLRRRAARLCVPGVLVLLGAACASVAHQPGFQTEGLAMTPGGPVEVAGSIGGYYAGNNAHCIGNCEGVEDVSDPVFWGRGTGHVRIPITRGTSIRLSSGVQFNGAGVQPTGAVSFFHPLRPHHADARWNGSFVWGGGALFSVAPRGLEDVVGGVHAGLIGSVRLTDVVHLALGTLEHVDFNLGAAEDGQRTVSPYIEGLFLFGPAFHLPLRQDLRAVTTKRPARDLYVMLEAGAGWSSWGRSLYPVLQLTIGSGQRPGASRPAPPKEATLPVERSAPPLPFEDDDDDEELWKLDDADTDA